VEIGEKISEKLHKISENLSKPPKIWAKIAPNGDQNHLKSFFWRLLFMNFFSD